MSAYPARLLAVSGLTAVTGLLALTGLSPLTGTPAVAGPAPSTAPVRITQAAAVAPQSLAAAPAAVAARPAAVPPTAVRSAAAGIDLLLAEQQDAGLDCSVSRGGTPLCVHGEDRPHTEHAAGTPSGPTSSSTKPLGCYGDGTSGPRVRAVYARPQSGADRYSSSLASIRGWASGLNQQFDLSAQSTGGRRHVRFATTPGSSCTLTVLNVVLPDSAFTSFSATIDALEARGLDVPQSKYLVWADASGYCGMATTYADDRPGLDNLNNSALPSYARVDRKCWGKVETHEVVHMLGGIQRSAANATAGFHCNDGLDVMCYDDGTAGSRQRAVCGTDTARLLDCRHDDYFSTAAPRGSYLQTHWNTARSSFLAATLTEPAPAPAPAPAPDSSRPQPATSPAPPSPSPSSSPSARPTSQPLVPVIVLPTLSPAEVPLVGSVLPR